MRSADVSVLARKEWHPRMWMDRTKEGEMLALKLSSTASHAAPGPAYKMILILDDTIVIDASQYVHFDGYDANVGVINPVTRRHVLLDDELDTNLRPRGTMLSDQDKTKAARTNLAHEVIMKEEIGGNVVSNRKF